MKAVLDPRVWVELERAKLLVQLLVSLPVAHRDGEIGVIGPSEFRIVGADFGRVFRDHGSDENHADLQLLGGGTHVPNRLLDFTFHEPPGFQ
jgi:hypothetical protein